MANAAKKNAIERRLEYLSDLWNEFAKSPEPRLLRWLVDGNDARMVELLFEVQNEETGDIPDLFIVLVTPFDDSFAYGFQLQNELQVQYKDSHEVLTQEGLSTDWQCPSPEPGESNFYALVRTCISFQDFYQDKMLVLAVVLTPEHIGDASAWEEWLLALIQFNLPSTIRIIVIDRLENPLLDQVAEAEPGLVKTVKPDLDMLGAIEELSEQAEGVGPGNDFRRLFVALTKAASQGNMKLAKTKPLRRSRLPKNTTGWICRW